MAKNLISVGLLDLKNKFIAELLGFASIGGLITVVSVFAYYLFLDVFNLPLYPVYVVVYCTAVVFSYMLNTKYTFKREANWNDSIKYFFLYVVGLIVGLGIISVAQHFLPNVSNFVLVLISIPLRVAFTFFLVKVSIYKEL